MDDYDEYVDRLAEESYYNEILEYPEDWRLT